MGVHMWGAAGTGDAAAGTAPTPPRREEARCETVGCSSLIHACLVKWRKMSDQTPAIQNERSDAPMLTSAQDCACSMHHLVDVAVQCNVEDMLEPMARSAFFHNMGVRKIRQVQLQHGEQAHFSVGTYFSSYHDLDETLPAWAMTISSAEVDALADKFLGTSVAGVPVEQMEVGRRPPRRVADRYVSEAALLANDPRFRSSLLASSRRLLIFGFGARPFNGRSLFRLALEDPDQWELLAQTALDFVARLIQAGALHQALSAELLPAAAELPPLPAPRVSMPLLRAGPPNALVSLLVATRPDLGHTGSLARPDLGPLAPLASPALGDAVSCGAEVTIAPAPEPTQAGQPPRRSVGTLLHPQDDLQPYSSVSVPGAIARRPGCTAEVRVIEARGEASASLDSADGTVSPVRGVRG